MINKYKIHTEPRVFTGNKKPEIKNRGEAEVFYRGIFISCKYEGEVCILFKSILIKTDFGVFVYCACEVSASCFWRALHCACVTIAVLSSCFDPCKGREDGVSSVCDRFH